MNIVIPTYNRVESLQKTLLVLCDSLGGMKGISFIVIDNCSTDSTKELLPLMKVIFDKKDLIFDYKINEENIGLDGSILYVAKNIFSENRFTWFLSDDDVLLEKGIRDFVETLMLSQKKMEIAQFINPQYAQTKVDKFLRASFLPSVALRGDFKSTGDIDQLLGTSYLHLAVVNTIVGKKSEIGESESIVGIQIPNISFRFNFFETFIIGYGHSFLFNNDIIPRQKAIDEAMGRAQHFASLALLDYAAECDNVSWNPTFSHIFSIYKLFGIKAYKLYIIILLKKIPKKLVKFLIFKKVTQYLGDIVLKREIIKKYD